LKYKTFLEYKNQLLVALSDPSTTVHQQFKNVIFPNKRQSKLLILDGQLGIWNTIASVGNGDP
jgi:hypothetical protein